MDGGSDAVDDDMEGISDAETLRLGGAPSGAASCASGPTGTAPSAVAKRSRDSESHLSSSGKKLKAEEEEPNPHQVGSYQHWLYELKFEKALDGDSLGRQIRQSKDKLPKLPEDQKTILSRRLELAENAVKLSYQKLHTMKDEEFTSLWTPLKRGGCKMTMKFRIALYRRCAHNLWERALLKDSPDLGKDISSLIDSAVLWHEPSQKQKLVNEFDPLKPTLLGIGASDNKTAQ
eukprot:327571-Pyramimonas_sp.AAC.1